MPTTRPQPRPQPKPQVQAQVKPQAQTPTPQKTWTPLYAGGVKLAPTAHPSYQNMQQSWWNPVMQNLNTFNQQHPTGQPAQQQPPVDPGELGKIISYISNLISYAKTTYGQLKQWGDDTIEWWGSIPESQQYQDWVKKWGGGK